MGKFENKSVIVTGGALGIGAATCEAFAREGAMVTIMDINEESGKELQEKILGQRGISSYFYADAGKSIDCKNTVDFASKTYGGVDIVFNNVGIQPPNSYLNAVDLPEEMWDRILDVNLKSRFLMAKYSIPEMRKRGGGVLIHSASVQGLQSMEGVSAYAATKGGDLSLVRQLSLDFAKENIRVLAVNPGAIDTLSDLGIDISKNKSKSIEDLDTSFLNNLDFVITLCAEEICPVLPIKAKLLRWMHEDPANEKFNEIESKLAFKKVRDNIYNLLKKFMIDNL